MGWGRQRVHVSERVGRIGACKKKTVPRTRKSLSSPPTSGPSPPPASPSSSSSGRSGRKSALLLEADGCVDAAGAGGRRTAGGSVDVGSLRGRGAALGRVSNPALVSNPARASCAGRGAGRVAGVGMLSGRDGDVPKRSDRADGARPIATEPPITDEPGEWSWMRHVNAGRYCTLMLSVLSCRFGGRRPRGQPEAGTGTAWVRGAGGSDTDPVAVGRSHGRCSATGRSYAGAPRGLSVAEKERHGGRGV